jgi:hypothetical protein
VMQRSVGVYAGFARHTDQTSQSGMGS